MVVYAAIAGLFAMMGGFVWYASLDNPQLELAEIELQSVEVISINTIEDSVKLQITFLVKNPSEKTFTVPIISYDLYANGFKIGATSYSTVDIAMTGRAAFFPDTEIPLKNFFQLFRSEVNSDIYQTIVNGENVKFSAKGMITVETAWSLVEKEFQSSL
ncbi:MAG: hypothetical protein IIA81_00670 [Thaumarchaeota archaeon]|nr:hypothetical protein [Nitrososphaerota archaeon]